MSLLSLVRQPDAAPLGKLDFKLLLNCLGPMTDDSIAQARCALLAILRKPKSVDQVSITGFGSAF